MYMLLCLISGSIMWVNFKCKMHYFSMLNNSFLYEMGFIAQFNIQPLHASQRYLLHMMLKFNLTIIIKTIF